MPDIKRDILELLITRADAGEFLSRETIEPLIKLPWVAVESYLHQLAKDELIELTFGGDEIQRIAVLPLARVYLLEHAPTSTFTIPSINIGNNSGSFVMNVGDNHRASNTVENISLQLKKAVRADMLKILNDIDRHRDLDSSDSVQVKALIKRILQNLETEAEPPTDLLAALNETMQKHSWIATPLASTMLRFLETLW